MKVADQLPRPPKHGSLRQVRAGDKEASMKLIGKQIVVELPEKENGSGLADEQPFLFGKTVGYNQALTEVAKMNPAWLVDIKELSCVLRNIQFDEKRVPFRFYQNMTVLSLEACADIAQALASDPSAWMKRKDSDEAKAE